MNKHTTNGATMAAKKAARKTAPKAATPGTAPDRFMISDEPESGEDVRMYDLGYPWRWWHEDSNATGYGASAADCLAAVDTFRGVTADTE